MVSGGTWWNLTSLIYNDGPGTRSCHKFRTKSTHQTKRVWHKYWLTDKKNVLYFVFVFRRTQDRTVCRSHVWFALYFLRRSQCEREWASVKKKSKTGRKLNLDIDHFWFNQGLKIAADKSLSNTSYCWQALLRFHWPDCHNRWDILLQSYQIWTALTATRQHSDSIFTHSYMHGMCNWLHLKLF